MNRNTNELVISNGISITNECIDCIRLNEVCSDCIEAKETNDIIIAYKMRDEGRDTEALPTLAKIQDEPSSHDWTDREGEFLPPVVEMADRFFDLNGAIELQTCEMICLVCHYVCNKHTVCPNCS
jgi:hypothetical protein